MLLENFHDSRDGDDIAQLLVCNEEQSNHCKVPTVM